eukprot:2402694-Alexandrium_andersonii.AAC.1
MGASGAPNVCLRGGGSRGRQSPGQSNGGSGEGKLVWAPEAPANCRLLHIAPNCYAKCCRLVRIVANGCSCVANRCKVLQGMTTCCKMLPAPPTGTAPHARD